MLHLDVSSNDTKSTRLRAGGHSRGLSGAKCGTVFAAARRNGSGRGHSPSRRAIIAPPGVDQRHGGAGDTRLLAVWRQPIDACDRRDVPRPTSVRPRVGDLLRWRRTGRALATTSVGSVVERAQTAATIFAAFLRASSRLPTYMKALSGRSSPSPLQIRSKLSIVSSRVHVTPGRPVKTSPT